MRGTANPLTSGPFSVSIPDTAGVLSVPESGPGLSDNLLRWNVNADVFMTPIANTNWSTIVADAGHSYRGYKQSSGAQNDSISFDLVLAAGTWTFEIIHHPDTDAGIYSVRLDNVEVGTIDGYNSVTLDNIRAQVTGITVSISGKTRLSLVMATKNASSSSYYGKITHLQFKRTA